MGGRWGGWERVRVAVKGRREGREGEEGVVQEGERALNSSTDSDIIPLESSPGIRLGFAESCSILSVSHSLPGHFCAQCEMPGAFEWTRVVVGFWGCFFVSRWGVVGTLGLGGCPSGSNRLMTSRSGQPRANRFPVCGRPITNGQFSVYRSIIQIPCGRPLGSSRCTDL